ncbi:multi-drug and toxic compound extrusion [Hibiscus trionum]|uniref:Protein DETOXIFICATION n=1 Tax=Hibiscus trionum TaxID=183268 RepID=A0A9W7GTS7_HIBTR|nr:multi-drug and toxic compound extrusion [Hibiscus trionum]
MAVGGISSPWNNMGKLPLFMLFRDSRNVLKNDELGIEIVNIGLPATLALMADPVASLIDTAFIGRIGAVELASVGVSIAIFNQVSRITMLPLVSITTSFVAEEEATSKSTEAEEDENVGSNHDVDHEMVPLTGRSDMKITKSEDNRRRVPSASSALVIGCMLGILQTLFLISTAKAILHYMGVKPDSPMLKIAQQYLTLRSLGAPAILLSLAAQGVFRGLKDTKTPLYAIIIGDSANILLDPILIFTLRLGVNGAAIAHVVSQYLIFLILIWRLVENVVLLPPSFKELQFGRFLKSGFHLLVKVISTTSCMTVATSLAARLGPKPMAAFQVCLQIWLATSLLADGLAVAGQAILASAFAKKDYEKTVVAASRVLQIGVVLGLLLSFILAAVSQFASTLFTKDFDVLRLMNISFPFIAVTQPINALAFVFDGVNYGASDFAYSACSMVLVAVTSISCLFILSSSHGYVGIWIALTIFMCLRVFAGLLRIGTGRGPWSFLRS